MFLTGCAAAILEDAKESKVLVLELVVLAAHGSAAAAVAEVAAVDSQSMVGATAIPAVAHATAALDRAGQPLAAALEHVRDEDVEGGVDNVLRRRRPSTVAATAPLTVARWSRRRACSEGTQVHLGGLPRILFARR